MHNNTINLYRADVPNMGDLLNDLIIKKCFGYDVKRCTYLTGEMSAIGSGLGQFTLNNKLKIRVLQRIFSVFHSDLYVWGTGFISYKKQDAPFCRKNVKVCAVRGELSKARVRKLLGIDLEVPTGDAGILANYLLDEDVEKIYDVGIIPHYKEQNEHEFIELKEKFPNSVIIDVREDPLEVVKLIAECRTIISSSLHGLIVADSFGIPNRHVVVTNNLMGDGFKFDDYYSAYGIQHEFTDLKKESIDSLEFVKREYKITEEMIRGKQQDMIACFPYPRKK